MDKKKIYFTAGPAKVPCEVMQQVEKEFLDYQGTNLSVSELSHRSKDFDAIINETESNLRKLMSIPENYAVLFMHGGARAQFDALPMNLSSELCRDEAEYIVTGTWSKIAANDAEKYIKVNRKTLPSDRLPNKSEIQESKSFSYRYYCDNETIGGVEFNYVPDTTDDTPLVCDMTSNFISRPVDVTKYGVIIASTQKNCGLSGLVIVIVRKNLLGKQMSITPVIMNYQKTYENGSRLNTPPTFNIYVANLCIKYVLEKGGLDAMDQICRQKSDLLYKAIEDSEGFYTCPVAKECRSRMNVVFLIANKELETKFFEEAKAAGLNELKGHRSVGGCRASLYHGISLEDIKRLISFMNEFRKAHHG